MASPPFILRTTLLTLGFLGLLTPAVHSAELRAGFAERDITPEILDSWADLDGNA